MTSSRAPASSGLGERHGVAIRATKSRTGLIQVLIVILRLVGRIDQDLRFGDGRAGEVGRPESHFIRNRVSGPVGNARVQPGNGGIDGSCAKASKLRPATSAPAKACLEKFLMTIFGYCGSIFSMPGTIALR